MDDGVNPIKVDALHITNVPVYQCQVGVRLVKVTEPHDVQPHHMVATTQELGHQYMTFVPAGTSNKNFHD
jgi:hypothetical protein